MDRTLSHLIETASARLDPDSRADRIIALCFQHNLFATLDTTGGRVLVGTLDQYLGGVDVGDDWDRIEEQIVAMAMTEAWG